MKKFFLNLKIAATMVACIAATSLLWNCSSEDDDEPTNAVRLVKSIGDGHGHGYIFEYDAHNRLTTVSGYADYSATATITYSDDRIFISMTRNNGSGSTTESNYTATLNSSGYIVEHAAAGSSRRDVFTYDDKGYLRTYNYDYDDYYTWLWDKGNVTTCSHNEYGSEDAYTYEDKIPNKPTSIDLGHLLTVKWWISAPPCHGWFGKSPVNLPSKEKRTYSSDEDETKFRYVMDNKGYVKEIYGTERYERNGVWGEWEEERLMGVITYY